MQVKSKTAPFLLSDKDDLQWRKDIDLALAHTLDSIYM